MAPSELWRTNPELSLRELHWMTRAKQRHDFDQVAELRAHMSNMFRAEGSRPVHPWSFHPFRKPPQRKQKRSTCTVQQLISAFVGL